MQKFVDVSNNNGPDVDFHHLKAAGAVGVYLKVTEGTTFVDKYYVHNYARAKAAGLKVGGYHFGHPKNSPSAELAFFLSHLKLEKGDLKPALDLEVADGMISSRVHAYGVAFLNGLKAKIGDRGVIYSGSYFLSANGLLGVPERKWIASYGAVPKSHWDAWQFTDGLPKYPGAIDHLDTSETPSIYLFVYKAPVHKRVPAAARKRLAKYQRELAALYAHHPHWHRHISAVKLKISSLKRKYWV